MNLDDPREIEALDDGQLRAAASAGAVVRLAARGPLPTSPVVSAEGVGVCAVLTSDRVHPAYGDALAEMMRDLGASSAVQLPLLERDSSFPRASDVVIVLSCSGDERPLVDAVRIASARGAEVVVAAPEGSPVAYAAAERRSLLVAHELAADDVAGAWWAAYAGAVALWRGISEVESLADSLDEAAAALGPVVASYDNPAKQLAGRDEPLLLLATDRASSVLGVALTAALASAGRAVRTVDVRRGFGELTTIGASQTSARDLFYDPDLDGQHGAEPPWQLVLLPSITGDELGEAAVRTAEHLGAVVLLDPPSTEPHWRLAHGVLLAQMAGAYRALVTQGQE